MLAAETSVGTTLTGEDLHVSLVDPVLDAMDLLNEIAARYPDAVSFAPGWPPEESFQASDIDRYLCTYADHVMRHNGRSAESVRHELFQYGRSSGTIQALVARHLAEDEDMTVDPRAILVTVGVQEAMVVVLRGLCARPEDVLLVQSPCFFGITGAARILGIQVEPVPDGPTGIEPERVAQVCHRIRATGRRPRAFYAIPSFANPSGRTLPEEVRRELLDVATAEELIIVEDNPYGMYSRTGARVPTLKSQDGRARVVYLGSFAKVCAPGVRVGYIVADQMVRREGHAPTYLAEQLTKLKSMVTINTSPIAQAIVGGMLLANDFSLRRANAGRIAMCAERLDTLLARLREHVGPLRLRWPAISWNEPEGGFFVVLRVPCQADVAALEECASRFGVLWTPMTLFYPGGGGEREIRLAASYAEPERIGVGVSRLASFLEDRLARG
jgi:DNA-binding transcriptional MocR family regulator